MPHSVSLISTIAVGLGLALIFGFAAARLRLPAIVGYLLAGVIIGLFTPGFVADAGIASQLAEIGRDAFAVLFFVSVGMLFDPWVLLERPLQVLAVVGIIIVGKAGCGTARHGIPLSLEYSAHSVSQPGSNW